MLHLSSHHAMPRLLQLSTLDLFSSFHYAFISWFSFLASYFVFSALETDTHTHRFTIAYTNTLLTILLRSLIAFNFSFDIFRCLGGVCPLRSRSSAVAPHVLCLLCKRTIFVVSGGRCFWSPNLFVCRRWVRNWSQEFFRFVELLTEYERKRPTIIITIMTTTTIK